MNRPSPAQVSQQEPCAELATVWAKNMDKTQACKCGGGPSIEEFKKAVSGSKGGSATSVPKTSGTRLRPEFGENPASQQVSSDFERLSLHPNKILAALPHS